MSVSDDDFGDDDHSHLMQHSEYSFQNRMESALKPVMSMSKAELRRSNKPIMEKRRRARINRCLNELKSLILDAMKKDPARHSKLEKADILEMTVKHLQEVQKRQLSAAMVADPAVMRKFRGGFEECATEVGRYIERLEGIDTGVRRRLASHLSSCVTTLPAARRDVINDNNNNSSAMLEAVSGSLRLIPSRLPNGEIALLLPDAQTLPGNVLPLFQVSDTSTSVPNLISRSFGDLNQVSTTTEAVTTDFNPTKPVVFDKSSHASAFTAVNKNIKPQVSEDTERSPSPTSSVASSVSSSGDRSVPVFNQPSKISTNMSSEVSSTSEQTAESTDPSSSFNSSTSSLSPQLVQGKPQPLRNSENVDRLRTVENIHQQPKELNPLVKKYTMTEFTADSYKTFEPFPVPKKHDQSKKRLHDEGAAFINDHRTSRPDFYGPLTVQTNLDNIKKNSSTSLYSSSVYVKSSLKTPLDFSVRRDPSAEGHAFQNVTNPLSSSVTQFEPSFKRLRVEGGYLPSFNLRNESEFAEAKSEVQSFSPRIIQQESSAASEALSSRGQASTSEASNETGNESMWRPW